MTAASLARKELVFMSALRDRANAVLIHAHQPSLQAFVEAAVRDLDQALVCLGVEHAEQSPIAVRAAIRLADLALDRIEIAETALREQGPNALVRQ
jgi:hypothetical protein